MAPNYDTKYLSRILRIFSQMFCMISRGYNIWNAITVPPTQKFVQLACSFGWCYHGYISISTRKWNDNRTPVLSEQGWTVPSRRHTPPHSTTNRMSLGRSVHYSRHILSDKSFTSHFRLLKSPPYIPSWMYSNFFYKWVWIHKLVLLTWIKNYEYNLTYVHTENSVSKSYQVKPNLYCNYTLGTKRNSVRNQINGKSVITIQISYSLTRFRNRFFCVHVCQVILSFVIEVKNKLVWTPFGIPLHDGI